MARHGRCRLINRAEMLPRGSLFVLVQLKHVLLPIGFAFNLRLAAWLTDFSHHMCDLILPHLTHEFALSRLTIRPVPLIYRLNTGYVAFLFPVVVLATSQVLRLLRSQVSQILPRCQLSEDSLSFLLWHGKLAMASLLR